MLNLSDLQEQELFSGWLVFEDGTEQKARFAREDKDNFFIFNKGKRTKGIRVPIESPYFGKFGQLLLSGKRIVGVKLTKQKSKKEIWEKSFNKAIKMLEKSGLWENELKNLLLTRDIGYNKVQKAHELYEQRFSKDYDENKLLKIQAIKSVDDRFIELDEKNQEQVETNIVWLYNPLKIKKMNFGEKQVNEFKLKLIAEAFRDKKSILIHTQAKAYDISFEYNADEQVAWYSEQYHGMLNGHYYIALNAAHALFKEDD